MAILTGLDCMSFHAIPDLSFFHNLKEITHMWQKPREKIEMFR